MPTSANHDEGTSNVERISSEVHTAAQEVVEKFPGYGELLAKAAIECFVLTAEHIEQRININQKYDQVITTLAREIGRHTTNGASR
ncbi:hypothetical protein [Streptomyces sp. NPDC047869]|uniref:hypothetical protein n=1 Tax=Streptomyces sp. NPDC047869 TaxID=3154709 RepID=UPI003456C830